MSQQKHTGSSTQQSGPRTVRFMPHRQQGQLWPKILHSENLRAQRCYVRYSVTMGSEHPDIRAVCTWHGHPCTLSKSCRYHRPVGRLWAWLNAGASCGSKEEHVAYVPSWEERKAARIEFESLGTDVSEFLEGELGGVGVGEPEATW